MLLDNLRTNILNREDMLKKTIGLFITTILFFFLTACSVEQNVVTQQSLVLDQGEGYLAISENNTDGYNRSLFFYFYLETNNKYGEKEVENILNDEILNVSLISTLVSSF